MDRFYIATFGCRTNQADSASIRDAFMNQGMVEAESPSAADLIIVNSCTVTHRSDQQVRQLARHMRRENPTARLVVTGCYAQRDPAALVRVEGVDLVVGTTHRERLVELCAQEFPKRSSGVPAIFRDEFAKTRRISAIPADRVGRRSRPLVKIQDGCDAACSYCIIPSVRGPSRSVPPEEVLAQVADLVEQGFQEIVLTGIHIGTYGLYLQPRTTLDRLLERIVGIPGLGLLRLSSIEPMELSRRIIELAAGCERIAPHFHICLQSGSDRVLRLMRRPYTVSRFQEIVEEIRERMPLAGIGTDVIAGFPGESDDDHHATLEFLEQSPMTYLHVFPYSDRPGTRASGMPDQLDPRQVRRRSDELRRLGRRMQSRFAEALAGQEVKVLTLSGQLAGGRAALSANYVRAVVDPELPPGVLCRGRVASTVPGSPDAGQSLDPGVKDDHGEGACAGPQLRVVMAEPLRAIRAS